MPSTLLIMAVILDQKGYSAEKGVIMTQVVCSHQVFIIVPVILILFVILIVLFHAAGASSFYLFCCNNSGTDYIIAFLFILTRSLILIINPGINKAANR